MNVQPIIYDTQPSLKQRLRQRYGPKVQQLVYATGAMRLLAHVRRIEGAIILMYHSVANNRHTHFIDPANHVPADIFERQMHFLVQHKKVIPLSALVKLIQKGKTPPGNIAVITFDDGYLDNLTVAAPILEKYNLPATLFLPTGYIDRGENQWIDQAYTIFYYRSKKRLTWGKKMDLHFDLSAPNQFQAAYHVVCAELLAADQSKRRSLLSELCEQLQPTTTAPRLTMTWEDVRNLVTQYSCFEIGGHSLWHTDLTSVTKAQAKNEFAACFQQIKNKTGKPPSSYSFCYGRTSETLRQLAAEAGFEAACGGQGIDPVIKNAADRYRLPRVTAPPSMERFDLLTSSVNTGIWRKLGRKQN